MPNNKGLIVTNQNVIAEIHSMNFPQAALTHEAESRDDVGIIFGSRSNPNGPATIANAWLLHMICVIGQCIILQLNRTSQNG